MRDGGTAEMAEPRRTRSVRVQETARKTLPRKVKSHQLKFNREG
jgi:hypothetical protein